MTLPQIFLASLIGIVFCFPTTASGNTLVPTEVDALRQIANTLGKTDWDFSVDPCSGLSGWDSPNQIDGFQNWVRCNCSSNGTDCHVASITLKLQNLQGKLPPELVKLPYLQEIDFTRNYLNGTIPPEWASLPLIHISLLGNRLTGSIPKEFGNISTLVSLVVEFNLLSGAIPAELGDLPRIEGMFLTSNNFSGELPPTFANLTTLKDFRIGDNQFTGKIPDFIQNWTHLEKLVIQGSGFDGPIPPGIGLLTNMSDLRISDLNGNDTTSATFPSLRNLTQLKYLILRISNMNGSLPEYPDLGDTTHLKVLDLSFNKLSGKIPESYRILEHVAYIYLAGNLLSGSIPGWILTTRERVDLSYNNFSKLPDCNKNDVNLFGMSSKGNTSGIVSCLPSSCPKSASMFHINCGGKEVVLDRNKYEADALSAEYLTVSRSTNWAFSSTGHFLDAESQRLPLTLENTSWLSVNSSVVSMDARLSAISLTYYGFCLENGIYDVKLHFAEIMFTDDKTYKSLGRRIFDIYIQGERVKKDFNIVDEAGGIGMEIVKNFTAVVNNTALEIRFYYAGKGTTAIPYKGVYGPLISAISVMKHGYVPPLENRNSISVGAVVGIVVAVAFVIILLLGILWWRGCLPCKDNLDEDLEGLGLQTGSFTLRQILAATNNFDVVNKIGEGGFGPVYKGLLSDGTVIAVKQLSSKSKQGNREFVNEIGMISALQHPHLVKLYGCCIGGNQLLLVYEYMENNSLARALFGPEECRLNLDWPTRYKICIGIARGLAYLHEESRLKIVHRDIKATNVLLDKNLNPKISDFGLAKLDEEDNTHISTRIAGTYGYMAPEYAMRGYLTDKADVYSFGIVALEIVCGRTNASYRPKEENFNLLDWALVLKEKGNLMELVDRTLGSNFNKKEVMLVIHIALQCTNVSPVVRPIMSSVVSMLESRTVNEVSISDPTASIEEMEMKGMSMIEMQCIPETKMSESLIQSMSTDGPLTASSGSTGDLYPVNLNSDYLASRN